MNKSGKYLFLILIVLLISIGGVYASDNNQTSTDVVEVQQDDGEDLVSVDTSDADGDEIDNVQETPTVETNLTGGIVGSESGKLNQNSEFKSGSESGNVLGATDEQTRLSSGESGGNFNTNLYNAINTNTGTCILTGDFRATGSRQDVSINKNLIIIGSNGNTNEKVTLDANGKLTRIFTIGSGRTVTFKNIIFTGTKNSYDEGGAIYIGSGSTVTFEDCEFNSNYGNKMGGAIYVSSNCKIIMNRTIFNSNYIYQSSSYKMFGGAVYMEKGCDVNIDYCTFDKNYVSSTANHNRGGGALYISDPKNVLINNSFFKNNYVYNMYSSTSTVANSEGGAIAFYDGCNNIRILNSVFDSNSATGYANIKTGRGAALHFSETGENVLIKNCTFNKNSATRNGGAIMFGKTMEKTYVIDSKFTSNNAYYGGAIMIYDSITNSEIIGCTFKDNIADNGEAGAINFYGNADNVTIGSTFIHNIATEHGPAIAFDNTTGKYYTIKFIGSVFKDHTTKTGTVYFKNNVQNLIVEDTIFENNNVTYESSGAAFYFPSADYITISNSNFTKNNAPKGGSLYIIVNTLGKITNCNFKYNTAKTSGAIFINSSSNKIIVDYCNFTGNKATSSNADGCDGGAIRWDASNGVVNNSNFINNSADGWGGAIDWNSATNFITTNSSFINNRAQVGGGLFLRVRQTTISFTKSNFTNNSATNGAAGAIYIQENSGIVTFDNCTMINNKATTYGGVAFVGTNTTDVHIRNSIVDDNRADIAAGTFCILSNTHLNINNSSFNNNSAPTAGAIYNYGPQLKVYSSNFTNNHANGDGGAIWLISGESILTDSKFINNSATNGGAIYGFGYGSNVSNSNFTNNTATADGGAIYWIGTSANINAVNFTLNTANNGGAVYLTNSVGSVSINSSEFNKNIANTVGGAIYSADSETSSVDINNSSFMDNSAKGSGNSDGGGAIYTHVIYTIHGSSIFTNNSAIRGGAVYLYGDDSTISNSTFIKNHVSKNGGAIFVNGNNNTITTTKFINNAADVNANAIWLANGNNNIISNSNFTGVKHIYVNGGNATLTNNIELSSTDSTYTVRNKGSIALSANKFYNIIDNQGNITTQTYANITGNATYTWDDWQFPLYANVTDDYNNTVVSHAFTYFTNRADNVEADNNVKHNATLSVELFSYLVDAQDSGLKKLNTYVSIINMVTRVGSYTWLQEKIDNLTENILYLDANVTFNATYDLHQNNPYFQKGTIFTYGMNYNKTFTLQGNNNYISGNNQARIFIINKNHVTINNITLTNGSAQKGGALHILDNVDDLTISNTIFENNSAYGTDMNTDGGGAIFANGDSENIKFINLTFNNNSAISGGAVLLFASHQSSYSNIDIVNCEFTNNKATADNDWGGSALTINQATGIKIDKSVFDSNSAMSNGAVMFDYCSDIEVTKTNFTNNNASRSAGAVYTKRDSFNVNARFNECLFENNTASGETNENTGIGNGGAVQIKGINFNFTNSIFKNNKVTGQNRKAGALYCLATNVYVDGCKFIENSASFIGGAIVGEGNANKLCINNTSFEKNTANEAGAISIYNIKDVIIDNSIFDENEATTKVGAIWFQRSEEVNEHIYGIINCNFTNNRAGEDTGAVYYAGNKFIISDCLFDNNHADGKTAALWFASLDGKILRCNFTNNDADGNVGAVYCDKNNILVDHSNFVNNEANGDAGAIMFASFQGQIQSCDFTNNTANNGGALYLDANEIVINKTSFDSNHAKTDGGAIFSAKQYAKIIDTNFTKNTAKNGAAILIMDVIKIISSRFVENIAEYNGTVNVRGASSRTDIENSTFIRNKAYNGAGVYYKHATDSWNPNLFLTNNTFIKNIASHNGGAVFYYFGGGKIYRDYNNFDGEGLTDANRTTVTFKSKDGYTTFSECIYK
ncbi:hypothetical protein [Methanobrevibacter sp.]